MARRARGEGSVYRDGDRWVAALPRDRDGRREKAYGRTPEEAIAKRELILERRRLGLPPARDSATVDEWLDWWLDHVVSRKQDRRASTIATYRRYANLWIKPAIGKIRLVDVAPEHIDLVIERAVAGGLAPQSVRHVHAVLRNALNAAVRRRWLTFNPATMVAEELPRVPRRENTNWLTEVEAAQLLDAAVGDRFYALYAVALAVGLRRGEAVALRWSAVDLDTGMLWIRRTVGRVQGQGLVETDPKTERSKRPVVLPDVCVQALRHHRAVQDVERALAGADWRDEDRVFAKPDGTGYDPRTILKRFQRLCVGAGVGHRTMRDLRHTAASLLLAQGVDVRVVQDILGHSSIKVTEIYTHVAPQLQADAAERMNRLLRGGRSTPS